MVAVWMVAMTPYQLWQRGMPLPEVVASSETGRQWAEKHADVVAACRHLQSDPRSPLFDRIESITRVQALAKAWQEQMSLLDEARERVKQRLCSGDLLACGFVGDSSQPQQLAAVPPQMWRHADAIDWDGGAVEGQGRRFVDVRVVPRPSQQERLDTEGTPGPSPFPVPD